eukprot:m.90916 g.90916  ORF g.90916 m.90916 type:complete len:783 (+) comp8858_c0_seq4:71-2419(+)
MVIWKGFDLSMLDTQGHIDKETLFSSCDSGIEALSGKKNEFDVQMFWYLLYMMVRAVLDGQKSVVTLLKLYGLYNCNLAVDLGLNDGISSITSVCDMELGGGDASEVARFRDLRDVIKFVRDDKTSPPPIPTKQENILKGHPRGKAFLDVDISGIEERDDVSDAIMELLDVHTSNVYISNYLNRVVFHFDEDELADIEPTLTVAGVDVTYELHDSLPTETVFLVFEGEPLSIYNLQDALAAAGVSQECKCTIPDGAESYRNVFSLVIPFQHFERVFAILQNLRVDGYPIGKVLHKKANHRVITVCGFCCFWAQSSEAWTETFAGELKTHHDIECTTDDFDVVGSAADCGISTLVVVKNDIVFKRLLRKCNQPHRHAHSQPQHCVVSNDVMCCMDVDVEVPTVSNIPSTVRGSVVVVDGMCSAAVVVDMQDMPLSLRRESITKMFSRAFLTNCYAVAIFNFIPTTGTAVVLFSDESAQRTFVKQTTFKIEKGTLSFNAIVTKENGEYLRKKLGMEQVLSSQQTIFPSALELWGEGLPQDPMEKFNVTGTYSMFVSGMFRKFDGPSSFRILAAARTQQDGYLKVKICDGSINFIAVLQFRQNNAEPVGIHPQSMTVKLMSKKPLQTTRAAVFQEEQELGTFRTAPFNETQVNDDDNDDEDNESKSESLFGKLGPENSEGCKRDPYLLEATEERTKYVKSNGICWKSYSEGNNEKGKMVFRRLSFEISGIIEFGFLQKRESLLQGTKVTNIVKYYFDGELYTVDLEHKTAKSPKRLYRLSRDPPL